MFDHVVIGLSDYEAGKAFFGPPGLRPKYHPGYCAAFVIGPDGHNIEAVHHDGSA